MKTKLLGIINVDFDAINQLSAFVRYWRKSGSIMIQYVSYLYTMTMPMSKLGDKSCTIFSLNFVYQRLHLKETYCKSRK
jgi:hypothetical protein